ncbi:FkbM family methyltransferase [Xanthobacter dioxanivorans]|uniref:FkbM family methyltransferase n=1 Tax=Xanthobacter dioxanivorans TaxID=2528964 RepID=A0A974PJG1_9HYPH|nr:FkbM family methyltransferase [Xanthobacter dioxanivorans]QRG04752.1 FkbM family methyltransferase [Xanthobacter dioxanivorans]
MRHGSAQGQPPHPMRYANLVKNISNWPTYFAFKYGLTQAPVAHFRLRSGVEVKVPREVLHEFKEVFFDEAYLKGMPLPVQPGDTVVDIGANIGAFSMFALHRLAAGRVIAFEPDPVNFAHLSANAALAAGRLVPVPQAISDTAGEMTFHRGNAGGVSTSGSLLSTKGEKVTVATTTLEEAFARHGIESCAFLKMDCEGAEFSILYGASDGVLKRIRQMVIEVHDQKQSPRTRADLKAHLVAKGFRLRDGMHDLLWAWRED